MTPAAALIENQKHFVQGTLYVEGKGGKQVAWDCLGALMHAHPDAEQRAPIAKAVFDLCMARFHHKRIGRLPHDEAFALLKDAGA